jgi:hypothetical protein
MVGRRRRSGKGPRTRVNKERRFGPVKIYGF